MQSDGERGRARALDAQLWCVRGGREMQRKKALDAELVCT